MIDIILRNNKYSFIRCIRITIFSNSINIIEWIFLPIPIKNWTLAIYLIPSLVVFICIRIPWRISASLACTNYTSKVSIELEEIGEKFPAFLPSVSGQLSAIIGRRLSRACAHVHARVTATCHEQVVLTGPYSAPLKRRQTYP